jgi:hypothetical protein
MKKDWMIFYHEGTMQHYVWDNGDRVPIPLGDGQMYWDPGGNATFHDADKELLTSVIGTKKKQFTIKGRGRFVITARGAFTKEA